jgi:hypothetical protein
VVQRWQYRGGGYVCAPHTSSGFCGQAVRWCYCCCIAEDVVAWPSLLLASTRFDLRCAIVLLWGSLRGSSTVHPMILARTCRPWVVGTAAHALLSSTVYGTQLYEVVRSLDSLEYQAIASTTAPAVDCTPVVILCTSPPSLSRSLCFNPQGNPFHYPRIHSPMMT